MGDMGARGACDYYLNISPSGTDRELHAVQGTGGGAEAEPGMTDAQVLKVLADKVAKLREKYPDVPPPPPPPAPKRDPTLTVTAPAHDGYDIKMDPSLNAVLANREQDKWKSPKFMVSAYDPKWLGQTLVLKGTVSRVEVERDGDPKWVHIYFKESPDAIITAVHHFRICCARNLATTYRHLSARPSKWLDRSKNSANPTSAFASWIRRRSSW